MNNSEKMNMDTIENLTGDAGTHGTNLRLTHINCLLGFSIGGIGTIYYFQYHNIMWSTSSIMLLAMFNGILTSIILETVILLKQMSIKNAFKTAVGMSLISMISMEFAMNLVDYLMTGGARLH